MLWYDVVGVFLLLSLLPYLGNELHACSRSGDEVMKICGMWHVATDPAFISFFGGVFFCVGIQVIEPWYNSLGSFRWLISLSFD